MAMIKALVAVLALAAMFELSMGAVVVVYTHKGWLLKGSSMKGASMEGYILTVAAGESVTVLVGTGEHFVEFSEADFIACRYKSIAVFKKGSARLHSKTPTVRYFVVGYKCVAGSILTVIWK